MTTFDFDFDYEVGTDATTPSLLPGKDQATTGHHYVAIFPKIGEKGEPFFCGT